MRPPTLPAPESFCGRPHGTRLRYISGCKCVPCRAANSRYESERAAARRRGEHGGIVSASRARRRLLELSRRGVGYTTVAATAGVSRSIVLAIRTGRKTRIRATTERKILRARAARAGGATVSGEVARRQVRALQEEGYSLQQIASMLGVPNTSAPNFLYRKGPIRAETARRVKRLYDAVMGEELREPAA